MRPLTDNEYGVLKAVAEGRPPAANAARRTLILLQGLRLIREDSLTLTDHGQKLLHRERTAHGDNPVPQLTAEDRAWVVAAAGRGLATGRLSSEEIRAVCAAVLSFARHRWKERGS